MNYTITALTIQKRNPNRVNVYLDGEFAFGLARIVSAWLRIGQTLTQEKIDQLRLEDDREVAYQHALRYLSYRQRTESELRTKLIKQDIPLAIIDSTLLRLEQNGLLNDTRFTQDWINNRSEFRPRSKRALNYELRQRGVDHKIIEQSLISLDEEELAYQAAQKQIRKLSDLDEADFRKKLLGYLARRGFNYEQSNSAATRIWQEIQEQDSQSNIHKEEVGK